ncbi:MAG: hypothetical protein H6811_00680 [Phycisphaeraceae bacterium]|nr:hypothetical protein [Phycisphaeraceae bacterium]
MRQGISGVMAVLGLCAGLHAQPIDPFSVTGRDFAGQRIPVEAVDGSIDLIAQRARVWDESGVRRLLLEGDVRMTIGYQKIDASRAVVWIARLADDPSGARVYQVHAYLEGATIPGSPAGLAIDAKRLPVRGVVRTSTAPTLRADLTTPGRAEDELVLEGERDLASSLRRQLGLPIVAPPVDSEESERIDEDLERMLGGLARGERREPIFAREGTISISYGALTAVKDDEDNAVLLARGVAVLYQDVRTGRSIQMSAQRGVVFLPPGPITAVLSELSPEELRGIYLEGEVLITDGAYTLRGPQVFYDTANDRALVPEAVFHTYDQRRGVPLYVRADLLRQQSASEFSAERATLAGSSFARPQLSLGAREVTLSRRGAEGERENWVRAEGVTVRAEGVPFLYVPVLEGDPQAIPLRRVGLDNRDGSGVAVRTGWDALALLGIDAPKWLSVELQADMFFDRGPALGVDAQIRREDSQGDLLAYWVVFDQGEDRLYPGTKLGHDGDSRAMLVYDQRWALDRQWALWLRGSYFTDENFVDAFFEPLGYEREPLTSGGMLAYRDAGSFFSIEAAVQANDFTVNQYALQTPGYVTEKLPEAKFVDQTRDLLWEASPGLLTLLSEYRAGLVRLAFTEPSAADLGFPGTSLAQRAFGIDPDESIADRLRDAGLHEDEVIRLDTRHEVTLALDYGPVSITPFAVARATFWDDNFEAFSPDENDRARLWGAAGVRAGTSVIRQYDGVESSAFDVHRVRHIIEPSATLWQAWTSIDRADLPVYDDDVENILEGSIVRLAVDQTFQTKRGGPGRWVSVDVLTLDTELVFTSESGPDAPIGRYFDSRPELSSPGDIAHSRATWRITDAVAASGDVIYDLELGELARTSVGLLIEHSPLTSTSIEMRTIHPLDSTFLDLANQYALGDRYTLLTSASYDVEEADFKRIGLELRREFPAFFLGAGVVFDNITDTTSFGFTIQPKGFGGGRLRVQGVGAPAGAALGS